MKSLPQSVHGPIFPITTGLPKELDAKQKTTHKNNADDDTFGEHQDRMGFIINVQEIQGRSQSKPRQNEAYEGAEDRGHGIQQTLGLGAEVVQ
jgi:hypothetical protein